jgi:penicillin-binding protein 1A
VEGDAPAQTGAGTVGAVVSDETRSSSGRIARSLTLGTGRTVAWVVRLGLVLAAGSLLLTAVVVGAAPHVWQLANAHREAPVVLPPFEDLAQRTYVYDAAENQIAVFELENSQPIEISEVPDDVVNAILAVEDREFYRHHGVNVRSLVRALLSNFESGSARQGASTITQQVAKVEYLAGLERDGRYKLLQAHYALMLERQLGKEEILERYLNTIYLGNNAYGLQAAAEIYFGKRVSELSKVEGGFLAGLIQAPSSYDPIREPEASRRRFREVLRAMVDDGLLTQERAERLSENWQLPEVTKTFPERDVPQTHFTQAVKDYLLNRSDILGETYQDRYNALFRGGLRIYTTLDPVLQEQAQRARDEQLPQNGAGIEASAITLDTKTGAVRAMLGGRPFVRGQNEVNLALRTRQTGSSIKFYILAAAVQAGAQAGDVIDGSLPCVLPNPGNPEEPFEITDGVSRGVSALDEMTWYSINCAYARLAQIVGLDRTVDTIYRMSKSPYLYQGQTDRSAGPIQPYASLATGANEMSAMDMAAGAQTLANYGVHMEPYYIERIRSPRGLVYRHSDPGTPVLTPEAAIRTVDIMKGVLISGTARRTPLEGRPSAGKTGTQDNNTNAWFVGFTPQYATAVWVGHPDLYKPMVNIPEFAGVPRVQGGTYPAAIWKQLMDAAHVGLPVEDWFEPPPDPRPDARLYLPGNECLAQVSSGPTPPPTEEPAGRIGRRRSVPTTEPATTEPAQPGQEPASVPTLTVPVEPTAPPPPPPPTETTAPPTTVVVVPVEPGTTIPEGVVDPLWPLNSTPIGQYVVYLCDRGIGSAARPAP